MAYTIDKQVCINCGACQDVCPVGAISEQDKVRVIDSSTCVDCGACAGVCPVNCITPGH